MNHYRYYQAARDDEPGTAQFVFTGMPVPLVRWGGFNPKTGEREQWEYRPQPDITAYELAQIIPFLIAVASHTNWNPILNPEWDVMKRHFRHTAEVAK